MRGSDNNTVKTKTYSNPDNNKNNIIVIIIIIIIITTTLSSAEAQTFSSLTAPTELYHKQNTWGVKVNNIVIKSVCL